MLHPPANARVLIAMSGGVDSAVAAQRVVAAGYDCVGVTMRLVPEHAGKSVFEPCCGVEAGRDARRVCDTLGIAHEVLYAVDRFDRDIITHFTDEYAAGRTPNPCVRCNRMIKFGALYQRADELGCDYIAMGHYVRLAQRGPRHSLRRAVYRPKDQSYVLAPLTQPQLRRAYFPLGEATKEEVRAEAGACDAWMAQKPESQEICFVPDRNYRNLLAQRGQRAQAGPILTLDGEEVGRHEGLTAYTIGQRRGLGIAAEQPYYVVRLDAARNAVIVGHKEDTLCARFGTGRLAWGGLTPCETPFDAWAQVRSRHDPVRATVTPRPDGARVHLHEPQAAVTPGQWAVFYDDDGFVLASATIRTFETVGEAERLRATATQG